MNEMFGLCQRNESKSKSKNKFSRHAPEGLLALAIGENHRELEDDHCTMINGPGIGRTVLPPKNMSTSTYIKDRKAHSACSVLEAYPENVDISILESVIQIKQANQRTHNKQPTRTRMKQPKSSKLKGSVSILEVSNPCLDSAFIQQTEIHHRQSMTRKVTEHNFQSGFEEASLGRRKECMDDVLNASQMLSKPSHQHYTFEISSKYGSLPNNLLVKNENEGIKRDLQHRDFKSESMEERRISESKFGLTEEPKKRRKCIVTSHSLEAALSLSHDHYGRSSLRDLETSTQCSALLIDNTTNQKEEKSQESKINRKSGTQHIKPHLDTNVKPSATLEDQLNSSFPINRCPKYSYRDDFRVKSVDFLVAGIIKNLEATSSPSTEIDIKALNEELKRKRVERKNTRQKHDCDKDHSGKIVGNKKTKDGFGNECNTMKNLITTQDMNMEISKGNKNPIDIEARHKFEMISKRGSEKPINDSGYHFDDERYDADIMPCNSNVGSCVVDKVENHLCITKPLEKELNNTAYEAENKDFKINNSDQRRKTPMGHDSIRVESNLCVKASKINWFETSTSNKPLSTSKKSFRKTTKPQRFSPTDPRKLKRRKKSRKLPTRKNRANLVISRNCKRNLLGDLVDNQVKGNNTTSTEKKVRKSMRRIFTTQKYSPPALKKQMLRRNSRERGKSFSVGNKKVDGSKNMDTKRLLSCPEVLKRSFCDLVFENRTSPMLESQMARKKILDLDLIIIPANQISKEILGVPENNKENQAIVLENGRRSKRRSLKSFNNSCEKFQPHLNDKQKNDCIDKVEDENRQKSALWSALGQRFILKESDNDCTRNFETKVREFSTISFGSKQQNDQCTNTLRSVEMKSVQIDDLSSLETYPEGDGFANGLRLDDCRVKKYSQETTCLEHGLLGIDSNQLYESYDFITNKFLLKHICQKSKVSVSGIFGSKVKSYSPNIDKELVSLLVAKREIVESTSTHELEALSSNNNVPPKKDEKDFQNKCKRSKSRCINYGSKKGKKLFDHARKMPYQEESDTIAGISGTLSKVLDRGKDDCTISIRRSNRRSVPCQRYSPIRPKKKKRLTQKVNVTLRTSLNQIALVRDQMSPNRHSGDHSRDKKQNLRDRGLSLEQDIREPDHYCRTKKSKVIMSHLHCSRGLVANMDSEKQMGSKGITAKQSRRVKSLQEISVDGLSLNALKIVHPKSAAEDDFFDEIPKMQLSSRNSLSPKSENDLDKENKPLIPRVLERRNMEALSNMPRENQRMRVSEYYGDHNESAVRDNDRWTAAEVMSLRNGYSAVNPCAHRFWEKVSKFVEGKDHDECQVKWFSMFDTPTKQRQTKSDKKSCRNAHGLPIDQVEDDLFHATPMRLSLNDGNQSFEKRRRVNDIDFGSPILIEKKVFSTQRRELDDEDDTNGFSKVFLFKKTYIHRLKRDIAKARKEKQRKRLKSAFDVRRRVITSSADISGLELKGTLTPGGTVKTRSVVWSDEEEGYETYTSGEEGNDDFY